MKMIAEGARVMLYNATAPWYSLFGVNVINQYSVSFTKLLCTESNITFGSSTEHFKERKFVFCILYHTFAVILTVTWGSYGLFLLTSLGSLVTGSAREVLAVLLALTCPAYGLFLLTGFGSLIAGSARFWTVCITGAWWWHTFSILTFMARFWTVCIIGAWW